VDAVLVGTGTLAIERYGRLIGDARARERRQERGLTPEPIACTVTRSGHVALDIPMFDEPEQRVVIFSGAEIDTSGVRAQVTVVEIDPDQLTYATVLSRLRHDFGVRALLCEGGPSVYRALLAEDVADQLFLSLSPQIAGGGDSPTIAMGPALPEPAQMILEAILECEGTLFLRYARPN
jgi:riboflavin biosynthesis pyrimidine reductase